MPETFENIMTLAFGAAVLISLMASPDHGLPTGSRSALALISGKSRRYPTQSARCRHDIKIKLSSRLNQGCLTAQRERV
jgi:hypothetical protein